MTSTYILYNIVPIGFVLLLGYIFFDIFLDYFRKTKKNNLKRVVFYAFLFYILSLIQIKWGGISLPIQNLNDIEAKYIPSNEWYGIYDSLYSQISSGNGFLEIFLNFILFIPFGILLSVLINSDNTNKKISLVILSCIGIGISHLFLEWIGLVMKSTNSMDVLFLVCNIFGGILGIFIVNLTLKIINIKNDLNKPKAANT